MWRALSIFMCVVTGVAAATLSVPSGSYPTIQAAANAVVLGDRVEVAAGTYNEDVEIEVTGSSGAWVNFVALTNGGAVIVRKFSVLDSDYVRLINFEVTHDGNPTYGRGITIGGLSSHIELIGNYIHGTRQQGVHFSPGSVNSFIVVRKNRFDYLGFPDGEGDNCIGGEFLTPHFILVEYNTATRFVDFLTMFGTNVVSRNNHSSWFDASFWNEVGHPDLFAQGGSDGFQVGSRQHIYERNYGGRSTNEHSHFGLWQDTVNAGDTNQLIRGNNAHYLGGGGIGQIGTDKLSALNNTLYSTCMEDPAGGGLFTAGFPAQPSVAGILANNVIQSDNAATDAIQIDPVHSILNTHNWGFLAGTETGYAGTADPLFVSTNSATLDLRLQAGSPLRGAGTNTIWATTNTTGTSFHVNDAQLLSDGRRMVEGDVVVIGSTTTRVVLSDWTNNAVTVATSVTVTNNQPVWWGRFGDQKDIGAYPYGAEYLTGGTYTRSGNTYTITPIGHARGAWVWVDGLPKTWVYDPIGGPFVVTEAGNVTGIELYAEWPQAEPVVLATEAGGGGGVSGATAVCIVGTGRVRGGRR